MDKCRFGCLFCADRLRLGLPGLRIEHELQRGLLAAKVAKYRCGGHSNDHRIFAAESA